jgi:hypothetical protein
MPLLVYGGISSDILLLKISKKIGRNVYLFCFKEFHLGKY